jgi:hypothetical protein
MPCSNNNIMSSTVKKLERCQIETCKILFIWHVAKLIKRSQIDVN